jgi:hypothetical protein
VQQNVGTIGEDSLPIDGSNNISNTGSGSGQSYPPIRGWLHSPRNGNGNTGDIGGLVKDSTTGSGISGANVTFSGGGATRNTTTDASGYYSFISVPAGSATVSASKSGYNSNSVPVNVNANSSNQVDIVLTPSGSQDFTLTSPSYSVQPNQQFNVSIRLHVNNDQFLESRGDHLYGIDNTYGAWPVQPIIGIVNAGQDFDFNFNMTAPGSSGTYTSHWQMKVNGQLMGPVATVTLYVNTPPPPPTGQWQADYYDGLDPSGSPRCSDPPFSGTLNKDWGVGAPCNGQSGDNWSARFTQQINFPAGTWTFRSNHDDGIRLYTSHGHKLRFFKSLKAQGQQRI